MTEPLLVDSCLSAGVAKALGEPCVGEKRDVLSCRYAAIDSMTDLHYSLMSQHELQTVAPSSRWDTEATFNPMALPGQVCSRFGTYVESTHAFDHAVFGLQPNEALRMDPQQR